MATPTAVPAKALPDPERPGRTGPSLLVTGLAIAASVACSIVLLWPQHGRVMNWDEVDYVTAARMGVLTNLLERGSLSVPEYIRFGRAKLSHSEPVLPPGYEESRDPFVRRHGHSPAVVVAMAPTSNADGERAQRAILMIGAAALTIALVVAYRLVSTTWTWAGVAVIVMIAPWYGWHLFRSIQFHGWSTVWLCLAVAFLCQWLVSGRTRNWGLALCASLAALILTLESSAFVILGVVVCVVIWVRGLRRRARVPWIRRYLLPGLLAVLAMTAVVWPGLVVKGGFLKLPAERFYQVFLGEGEVYFFNRSADVLSYLLPIAIGAFVLVYLWRNRREEMGRWGPLVVVAAIYLASVVRFAVSDAYFLPAFAPLLLLFAWVVGDLKPRTQALVAGGLAVVMLAGAASIVRSNRSGEQADRQTRADLAFVGDFVGTSRALMDGGHIFRYYLPEHQIEDISFNNFGLLVRRAGKYEPVPPSAYQGTVVGILATRTSFLEGAPGRELSRLCPMIGRPTIVLWDCRSLTA